MTQRATRNRFLVIISIISGMLLQKFAGSLVWAPFSVLVRPNMLNMPKSASAKPPPLAQTRKVTAFPFKVDFLWKKVCWKVSLCEKF